MAHLIVQVDVRRLQCLQRLLYGLFDVGRRTAYCRLSFPLVDNAEFCSEEYFRTAPSFCKPAEIRN